MRIDNVQPSLYTQVPQNEGAVRNAVPANTGGAVTNSSPAYTLDISPKAWAAYEGSNGQAGGISAPGECQTCKNRTYKDESNDPSVSFQTPTRISPGQAFSSVMAHESEHVSHEQMKAEEADRRIISQTVSVKTAACPECGRIYVSGGVTRTVTAADNEQEQESV